MIDKPYKDRKAEISIWWLEIWSHGSQFCRSSLSKKQQLMILEVLVSFGRYIFMYVNEFELMYSYVFMYVSMYSATGLDGAPGAAARPRRGGRGAAIFAAGMGGSEDNYRDSWNDNWRENENESKANWKQTLILFVLNILEFLTSLLDIVIFGITLFSTSLDFFRRSGIKRAEHEKWNIDLRILKRNIFPYTLMETLISVHFERIISVHEVHGKFDNIL